MKEYYELLMLFAQEFSQKFEYGQEYRYQCFEEIASLMFGAVNSNTPSKFSKALSELEPFLVSLNNGKKTVSEIAQGLKGTDDKTCFHLICYSYLIIIEGIFDELIRVIYFLFSLRNGNSVSIDRLKKLEVRQIYDKIDPKPIILKNWSEKKHIRNAIGHAKVYYNQSKREITFVDDYGKFESFKKTFRWEEFIELLAELESASEAFILFTLLLKLHDLLFAPKMFD